MIIQWRSKRIGAEFIDVESFQRDRKAGRFKTLRCIECKGAPVLHDIEFGADFCSPRCYIKFYRGYIAAQREYFKKLQETNDENDLFGNTVQL